jgi:hypothetical protein
MRELAYGVRLRVEDPPLFLEGALRVFGGDEARVRVARVARAGAAARVPGSLGTRRGRVALVGTHRGGLWLQFGARSHRDYQVGVVWCGCMVEKVLLVVLQVEREGYS